MKENIIDLPIKIDFLETDLETSREYKEIFEKYLREGSPKNNNETSVDDSDIAVSEVRLGRVRGAFDTPFYVGLLVSFPIGVTASMLATWLMTRFSEARQDKTKAKIVFSIGEVPIEIDSGKISNAREVLEKIEAAIQKNMESNRKNK